RAPPGPAACLSVLYPRSQRVSDNWTATAERLAAPLYGDTTMAKSSNPLVSVIDRKLDVARFREQHWEGTFWEYLDIVTENPSVSRNAFQRVYDMILSYGHENYMQFKQEYVRYHFFADPIEHGADAIYGLARPLM